MKTGTSRLLANTLWNVLCSGYVAVLTVFFVPMILGALGTTAYGIWALLGSVYAFTPLLQVGFSSAINRHVPICIVEKDNGGITAVVSTSVAFFAVLALACAILGFVAFRVFPDWVSVPTLLRRESSISIVVMFCLSVPCLPFQPFMAVLSGYQRYDLTSLARVVPLTLRAMLLLFLLPRLPHITTVACIFASTEALVTICGFMGARSVLPRPTFQLSRVSVGLFKQMLAYGVNTFLFSMGAVIMHHGATMVIGIMMGPDASAAYSVAATAPLMMSSMVECFSAAIKPAVTELHARSGMRSIASVARNYQRYVFMLLVPPTLFLVIMGKEFLWIWSGRVLPGSVSVLVVLAIGYSFRLYQHTNFLVLVALGRHHIFGVATVLMALAACIMVYSFIAFGWGLIGAALGIALPLMFVSAIVIPRKFKLLVPGMGGDGWSNCFSSPLSVMAPTTVCLVLWKVLHPPSNHAQLIVVLITTSLVAAFGSWRWGLQPSEKERIRGLLRAALVVGR